MKFIREIPRALIKQDEITRLDNFGFTLVWKAESVEIWAEVFTPNSPQRHQDVTAHG